MLIRSKITNVLQSGIIDELLEAFLICQTSYDFRPARAILSVVVEINDRLQSDKF